MRTVFHLSSATADDWRHALANVENLLADETLDLRAVELVVNGDAVSLLRTDAELHPRVTALLERDVRVCACRNSLDTRPAVAATLHPGVDIVPSGVGELTRRQAEGYAYIKTP